MSYTKGYQLSTSEIVYVKHLEIGSSKNRKKLSRCVFERSANS